MRMHFPLTVGAVLGTPFLAATAQAQEDPADQIKYRQNTRSAVGGHVGAMSLLLRGKVDHPAHLAPHARSLNALAATFEEIFPDGSDLGETKAKAEIWSQPEAFASAIAKAQVAITAFTAAVEAEDEAAIGPAFKSVGDACKGCHEEFPQKDE